LDDGVGSGHGRRVAKSLVYAAIIERAGRLRARRRVKLKEVE
jgi:hypothetical protein